VSETEKLRTYQVSIADGAVFIDPA